MTNLFYDYESISYLIFTTQPTSPTKSRGSPSLSNSTNNSPRTATGLSAPRNLNIHVRSDTSISLSWLPSRLLNDKNEPILGQVKLYRLSISVGGRQKEVMEVPHTQAVLGGLTPGLYK